MEDHRLPMSEAPVLNGHEPIQGTSATVLDFWRFAMSDLRMNNVRGYFAEFLVAQAVQAPGPRVEWDSHDVTSPEGIRIEVKASGYLQAWEQRQPSRITFSGLSGRTWTTAGWDEAATFNADVYVFAVQTATDHSQLDPLDATQWEFYVASRSIIRELGQRSIGLTTLRRIAAGPMGFQELADAVREANSR